MKEYRFQNQVGAEEAWKRIEPQLGSLSREYGLTVEKMGPACVKLKRTGVEVLATITEKEVIVGVDLAFLLRPVGGQIEKALNERIPLLIRG